VQPRVSWLSVGYGASSAKKDAAGLAVQLGSCAPKVHAHDSAVVAGKGHTCLTTATVTGKAGVACQ
jgi:hypothetical protein